MNLTEAPAAPELRPRLIQRLAGPLARFLHVEAAGGVVLLACTAVALAIANSPWAAGYAAFWQAPLGLSAGGLALSKPLVVWINDGLMAIFFFVVGLEIKRELALGELRGARQAALPVAAALGGMAVPAAVYLALQWGQPAQRGWGVPMATDIAFVVGFLALLGRRAPAGLKVLLLAIAIIDDLGAVLIIALAYTAEVALAYLAAAAAGLALVVACNRLEVRAVWVYVVLGVGTWLAVLKSGVHPTVAGALLGLLTPARPWVTTGRLAAVAGEVSDQLRQGEDGGGHEPAARLLETAAREALSPLERLEAALHPWVAFGIMPLFALANAGVAVAVPGQALPVAAAVAVGLAVGKPVGIVALSWVAVRLGVARLPAGVGWQALLGGGCLAGVGFTMSLFIAGLALRGEALEAGKVGTLAGSAASAVLGSLLLLLQRRDGEPP